MRSPAAYDARTKVIARWTRRVRRSTASKPWRTTSNIKTSGSGPRSAASRPSTPVACTAMTANAATIAITIAACSRSGRRPPRRATHIETVAPDGHRDEQQQHQRRRRVERPGQHRQAGERRGSGAPPGRARDRRRRARPRSGAGGSADAGVPDGPPRRVSSSSRSIRRLRHDRRPSSGVVGVVHDVGRTIAGSHLDVVSEPSCLVERPAQPVGVGGVEIDDATARRSRSRGRARSTRRSAATTPSGPSSSRPRAPRSYAVDLAAVVAASRGDRALPVGGGRLDLEQRAVSDRRDVQRFDGDVLHTSPPDQPGRAGDLHGDGEFVHDPGRFEAHRDAVGVRRRGAGRALRTIGVGDPLASGRVSVIRRRSIARGDLGPSIVTSTVTSSPTVATFGATAERTCTERADHHPAMISNTAATTAAARIRITAVAPVRRAIAALASHAPAASPYPATNRSGEHARRGRATTERRLRPRCRPSPSASRRVDPGEAVGDELSTDIDADVRSGHAVRERRAGRAHDVVGGDERPARHRGERTGQRHDGHAAARRRADADRRVVARSPASRCTT